MRILEKEFGSKNIQDISTWQIEKFRVKKKEKYAPATINREVAVLKHFFSKAVEWGKMKENPAKKVKSLKGMVKRVRYLMPNEVRTFLSNCADFIRPIVTVAIHTGMRKMEILGLKWPQVDFEQGIITILDTKNSERKDIPMDDTVRATLQSLEREGEFVFCYLKGRPFNKTTLHNAFHEALKLSGITDFRFHDLRHTFASNLVMAGVKIEKVQKLMGHKLLTMTQRYAHLAPGYLAESVKVLDQVMAQNSPQAAKVINLNP